MQRVNSAKLNLAGHYAPLFALFLCNLLYCHRFYGVYFPLEGDALFHIYFRLNEGLMQADHNPHQWYFSSLMSFTGVFNPLLFLVRALLAVLPLDPLAKSIATNMLVSFLCSTLLSFSTYCFLQYAKLSRVASVLGAITITFTGLHLAGIREFNYVFSYSFIFVPLVLMAYLEMVKKDNHPFLPSLAASVLIGLSLWGGGNVPMFFYLPFCAALPLLVYWKDGDTKRLFQNYGFFALSLVLAFGIGAIAIFPTADSLHYSNRVEIQFDHIARSLPLWLKIQSLFLRDWFPIGIIHLHERDYFLGLPAVVLMICGLISYRRAEPLIKNLLVVFLVASLVITSYTYLPEVLKEILGRFYDLLSMRNSNRFFLLGLLPAAYLVGLGFDSIKGRAFPYVNLLLSLFVVFLIQTCLAPSWNGNLLDFKYAALASLSFCLFALIALSYIWWQEFSKGKSSRIAVCLFTAFYFLVFFTAPVQFTSYFTRFYNNRELLAEIPDERLTFSGFFGMKFNYKEVVERAKSFFVDTPLDLLDPTTRIGRIFDTSETNPEQNKNPNLFAPQTGHQFAFSLVDDHLSSYSMQQLYRLNNPAIFDLNNVCWTRDLTASPSMLYRGSCLPRAFYVGEIKKFSSQKEVLEWMRTASSKDFQKSIGVDCSAFDCSKLLSSSGKFSPVSFQEAPGHYTLSLDAPEAGYVFLSTHYRKDWVTNVNGSNVPTLRANHAFIAVPVPKGRSEIKLKLTLQTRTLGRRITFLTLLTMLMTVLLFERKRLLTQTKTPNPLPSQ